MHLTTAGSISSNPLLNVPRRPNLNPLPTLPPLFRSEPLNPPPASPLLARIFPYPQIPKIRPQDLERVEPLGGSQMLWRYLHLPSGCPVVVKPRGPPFAPRSAWWKNYGWGNILGSFCPFPPVFFLFSPHWGEKYMRDDPTFLGFVFNNFFPPPELLTYLFARNLIARKPKDISEGI